ncbi:MAG TPA: restriction endonuclease subunit S [Hanamia sp.]|nr:restriction endonuclease subunit S [Hanamia sp.]
MSKETKNKMVPRLRFPEFCNSIGWQVKPLSKELSFQTGFPFDSGGFNIEGIGVRLIKNRDLKADDRITYYNKPFDEKFIVNDGDVLVGMDGEFSPMVWMKGRALLNQRVGRILAKENSDLNFLFYFLSIHLKRIEDTTARTTVKHLSHSDIENINEALPTFPEQQKISSCLSSLDELITAENQKLEALKEHKKGLMQQLFPAEGKKVPELRFAEFKGSGEWEEDVLERKGIASFINEKIPLDELQLENYVSTENLLPNYGDKTMSSNLPSSGSSTRYRKNDILLSNIRPYLRKVWLANINGGASNDIIVIRAEHKLEPSFLSLLLRNDKFINYIMKGAEGVKMPRGDKDLIKLYPLAFPQKEEQKKIAECIFCLDELITEQAERIEALKQHKKGLMQGLFPSTS